MPEAVVIGGLSGQLGARLLPHLTVENGWHVLAWDVRTQRGRWHSPDGSLDRDGVSHEVALKTVEGLTLRGVVALSGRYENTPFLGQAGEREKDLFAANYFAVTDLLRSWLPTLIDRRTGTFITISTRGAVEPYPGAATYLAAKAATLTLTEALTLELGEQGIRGHCLVCGPMCDEPVPEGSVAYRQVAERICHLLAEPGPTVDYLPALNA
ncbi:SDR family NAD(P)-dependent oxidoreductase [Microbacterium sp. A93]|uniref:SDR family NAD(P)-dependent oxidoreductase n=1 Tax=Microbacterium sp. A93 TaxID=3450716 RepID=UPI003F43BD0A